MSWWVAREWEGRLCCNPWGGAQAVRRALRARSDPCLPRLIPACRWYRATGIVNDGSVFLRVRAQSDDAMPGTPIYADFNYEVHRCVAGH